jgi:hypothetical protein
MGGIYEVRRWEIYFKGVHLNQWLKAAANCATWRILYWTFGLLKSRELHKRVSNYQRSMEDLTSSHRPKTKYLYPPTWLKEQRLWRVFGRCAVRICRPSWQRIFVIFLSPCSIMGENLKLGRGRFLQKSFPDLRFIHHPPMRHYVLWATRQWRNTLVTTAPQASRMHYLTDSCVHPGDVSLHGLWFKEVTAWSESYLCPHTGRNVSHAAVIS